MCECWENELFEPQTNGQVTLCTARRSKTGHASIHCEGGRGYWQQWTGHPHSHEVHYGPCVFLVRTRGCWETMESVRMDTLMQQNPSRKEIKSIPCQRLSKFTQIIIESSCVLGFIIQSEISIKKNYSPPLVRDYPAFVSTSCICTLMGMVSPPYPPLDCIWFWIEFTFKKRQRIRKWKMNYFIGT